MLSDTWGRRPHNAGCVAYGGQPAELLRAIRGVRPVPAECGPSHSSPSAPNEPRRPRNAGVHPAGELPLPAALSPGDAEHRQPCEASPAVPTVVRVRARWRSLEKGQGGRR